MQIKSAKNKLQFSMHKCIYDFNSTLSIEFVYSIYYFAATIWICVSAIGKELSLLARN